jgi:hypothetical protein
VRITLACPECAKSTGGTGSWFVETIREDGLYQGKCPNSHDLLIALQTLRHEMLFEIALNAIVDGYYREAISSFAASVERFFEFALLVIAKKRGIEKTLFQDGWKIVARQSERQFGAYVFLYLTEFGKLPRLLSQKMVELRNEVTHHGSLPEKKDVIKYGRDVYAVIQCGVKQLRPTHHNEINMIIAEHMIKVTRGIRNRGVAVGSTTTALNVVGGFPVFDKILKNRGILG